MFIIRKRSFHSKYLLALFMQEIKETLFGDINGKSSIHTTIWYLYVNIV